MEFHRGFIEEIGIDGDVFLEHEDEFHRVAPLQSIVFYRYGIGDRGAKALASARHFGSLERLVLAGNDIGNAGAKSLAAWKAPKRIHTLLMQANPIGERAGGHRTRFGRANCRFG